jgi:hypothetical protein
MPGSAEILAALGALARAHQPLAAFWHAYFVLIALATIRRPSNRLLACLLIPPVASVALLAWLSGNLFTGAVLGVVSGAGLALGLAAPAHRVVRASGLCWYLGFALLALGLVYPHFLKPSTPFVYFYAAPVGIVPCPTLLAVVGLTLMFSGLGSSLWCYLLGSAGIFYGFFGAVQLGVSLDWSLAFAGASLWILKTSKQRPAAA